MNDNFDLDIILLPYKICEGDAENMRNYTTISHGHKILYRLDGHVKFTRGEITALQRRGLRFEYVPFSNNLCSDQISPRSMDDVEDEFGDNLQISNTAP